MSPITYIGDDAYVSLETVAECYECSMVWVREIYDFGLLGVGEVRGEQTLIKVVLLDRVANIIRLHAFHDLDLDVIAALLG